MCLKILTPRALAAINISADPVFDRGCSSLEYNGSISNTDGSRDVFKSDVVEDDRTGEVASAGFRSSQENSRVAGDSIDDRFCSNGLMMAVLVIRRSNAKKCQGRYILGRRMKFHQSVSQTQSKRSQLETRKCICMEDRPGNC